MKLAELQQEFLDYLQSQKLGEPHRLSAEIVNQGKINADQRLEIYGNAYRIRLIKVIETDHPVLATYLGDELFDELTDGYLSQHPSTARSLREFCRPLPAYLTQTPPFSEHPILAEIATFEIRLRDSFDAPEHSRMDFNAMQQLPPEKWPDVQLRLHPSLQIHSAHWNSVESWQAIKAEQTPPSASPVNQLQTTPSTNGFQAWLLWRDHDRLTQFRSLDTVEYHMLKDVLNGCIFAVICEHLLDYLPESKVSQTVIDHLRRWFDDGLIASIN